MDLTLVSVNWNNQQCLELMLKSYAAHHFSKNGLKLLLADNGSDDGSQDWLIANEIPFLKFPDNMGHEQMLNVLYPAISTQYVLIVDTDIIFKENVWPMVNSLYKDKVATGDLILGDNLHSPVKPRLGAWFILADIKECRKHGITYFRNTGDWSYDVGSHFYENIIKAGLDVIPIQREPGNIDRDVIGMRYESFDHLLRMSWDTVKKHPDRKDEVQMRMLYVKEKLQKLQNIDLKGRFI